MNKILISAKHLQKKLKHSFFTNEYHDVIVADKKLTISGISIGDVECSNDFNEQIKAISLIKLTKFLKIISDQPICLGFKNGWVWIHEATL